MVAIRIGGGGFPERRPGIAADPALGPICSVRALVTDDRRGRACLAVACAMALRHGLERVAVTPLRPAGWWEGVDATPVCPLLPAERPGDAGAELDHDRLVLLAWEHGVDAWVGAPLRGRPPARDMAGPDEFVVAPASWLTAARRILALRPQPWRPRVYAPGGALELIPRRA
jgi:hypothetical protein